MNILHIDSSILGDHSVSRLLSEKIVARQAALHPGATITRRDLAAEPIAPLSSAYLAALRGGDTTGADLPADVGLSDVLIGEIFAADIIVIGVPMYNFSVPVQLKTWLDRICIAGKTFSYGANGPQGLVPGGKTVFLASARGGIYSAESGRAAFDHQETQLAGVLGLIGLRDQHVIRAEGVAMGEEARARAIAGAEAQIAALAA